MSASDARAKRVALVAHCHLNVNTKIAGYADYPGVRTSLISRLIEQGVGIIQLPCPEIIHAGMKRWGACYEQYDTVAYRKTARVALEPIITTLIELTKDDVEIVGVYGVDGSPSCGVDRTCVGYEGGDIESLISGRGDDFDSDPGRPTQLQAKRPLARDAAKPGVFMEELQHALADVNIACEFIGIEERA